MLYFIRIDLKIYDLFLLFEWCQKIGVAGSQGFFLAQGPISNRGGTGYRYLLASSWAKKSWFQMKRKKEKLSYHESQPQVLTHNFL